MERLTNGLNFMSAIFQMYMHNTYLTGSSIFSFEFAFHLSIMLKFFSTITTKLVQDVSS